MCREISAQIERYPSQYPSCGERLLMTGAGPTQILTSDPKGNAISVALATERNSAMNRSELADLNAFVVVANHLSFRAASAQLGVTASALSHSMRQLEERLGARLLHRTTRSVSLTDAGLRLLEQLRPAIDQISRRSAKLGSTASASVWPLEDSCNAYCRSRGDRAGVGT